MTHERGLRALRFGTVGGAGIGLGLMLFSLRGPPTDSFLLIVVSLGAVTGGYLGCEAVIALARLRHSPVALLKAIVFLTAFSLIILVPTAVDGVRAHWFLAHADSTQGVVTRTHQRGGKRLWMSYVAGDSDRVVSDIARRATDKLEIGDSAWVFWAENDPTRATVGQPEPDWRRGLRLLPPVWLIGGILFLAYSVSDTHTVVPGTWRRPLHLTRAYIGAAAMADVGFALTVVLDSDLHNPRVEVSAEFWGALAFGALFALIFTVVLGSIALLVLLDRRWTSAFAFAVSGILFGAVGGLTIGPAGLLAGSISGLFAGLAFRWLYFRGGDPSANPEAAA